MVGISQIYYFPINVIRAEWQTAGKASRSRLNRSGAYAGPPLRTGKGTIAEDRRIAQIFTMLLRNKKKRLQPAPGQ